MTPHVSIMYRSCNKSFFEPSLPLHITNGNIMYVCLHAFVCSLISMRLPPINEYVFMICQSVSMEDVTVDCIVSGHKKGICLQSIREFGRLHVGTRLSRHT